MEKNYKPWLATALSFVFAGLGHLYVGSYLKGVFYMLLDSITVYLIYFYPELWWVQVITIMLSIISSFEAYNLALAKPGKENKIIENKTEIQKELKIY
jgi:TM2 domain-containing membrane protein YozV